MERERPLNQLFLFLLLFLVIQAKHGSFLETDPNDAFLSQVEYLLLDPSCSGSGIISRLDHLADVATTSSQSSSECRSHVTGVRSGK